MIWSIDGEMTGVDALGCLELKNVTCTTVKGVLLRVIVELSNDTSFISTRRVLMNLGECDGVPLPDRWWVGEWVIQQGRHFLSSLLLLQFGNSKEMIQV